MIDIRTSHYFQLQFVVLGIGLLVGSALLLTQTNYIIAPLFLLFGIIFLTTHNRLDIDPEASTFREYVWLLGFKIGKTKSLPKPTHIVINPTRKEIKFGDIDYGRVSSVQRRATAYLKLDEHDSIFLGDASNSKTLSKKLAEVAEILKLPIKNNAI